MVKIKEITYCCFGHAYIYSLAFSKPRLLISLSQGSFMNFGSYRSACREDNCTVENRNQYWLSTLLSFLAAKFCLL